MSLIEASSVAVKTMADGTLRISCDVEPRFAVQAFTLFGSPGVPMVIGRLVAGAKQQEPEPEPAPDKPRGGALARLAGQWCQKPEFVEWLKTVYPAAFWSAEKTHKPDPETAAQVIRVMCGITSRAELDTDKKAAETFDRAVRKPFAAYL